jgi:hypothetical protein
VGTLYRYGRKGREALDVVGEFTDCHLLKDNSTPGCSDCLLEVCLTTMSATTCTVKWKDY